MAELTLFYSKTSPYSRKALMCVMDLLMDNSVDLEVIHPLKDNDKLRLINPLGKVPALTSRNGELIVGSQLICRFLDNIALSAAGGRSLIAGLDTPKLQVELFEVFADGIMDAAYLYVMESLRPESEQSNFWKKRWLNTIDHTICHFEKQEIDHLRKSESHLGKISLACALGYLDFRIAALEWRKSFPEVSRWFEKYTENGSFNRTVPEDS